MASGSDPEVEFSEFTAAHVDGLRRLGFLLCGDQHAAEDAVQQTLIRLYAVWHRTRSETANAYARRILINVIRTEHSRAWYRRVFIGRSIPDGPAVSDTDGASDRMTVLAALARLPRRQRAVVVLRFWEDRSVAETAAIMRCSVGTVKSQSAKGLAALRAILADTYSTKEGLLPI
ncbi:SigE family RNA polymerase sigma factor [Stackebrandtia soli]|uniref:SigE family RNA polymerase sigma factor n=1 Tax=Stackebrandtia soli TaxID=1892856 RepID=UPI0039E8EF55